MKDFDDVIRGELSTHLERHPMLDERDFHTRLAERKHKRTLARLGGVSAVALLVLLAVMAPLSLDLTDRSRPRPSKRPPPNAHVIAVPGRLQDVAVHPDTDRVWVQNHRGRIGYVDADRLRLVDRGPQRSPSGWRAFAAAPDRSLWVGNGRRVQHVDRSGELIAATRVGTYVDDLEVGSGYVWALDGASGLTRIHPKTLEQETVAIPRSDDIETLEADDLAVGFGAAWVGGGESGEVLRIDATTLEITPLPIGEAGDADRQAFAPGGYAAQVMVADDEVWVCCDGKADLVALDPTSREVAARMDLAGQEDDEPGGDVQLAFGNGRVWVTSFGRYDGHSFEALFAIDPDTYEVEGPFPLQTEADELVATRDGLLVSGRPGDLSEPIFYRLWYSDVDDLPYPEPERSKASLRGWLIILAVLAGFVILIFYLGREEPDPAEE